MADGICSVPGCGNTPRTRDLCYPHYMKAWRYGTPTPEHAPTWHDVRGQRFGTLVVTNEREGRFWVCRCDCGESTLRTVDALRKSGDKSRCSTPGKHYPLGLPSYRTAHCRVRFTRGSASLQSCVDCGRGATQWSYNHADPHEIVGTHDGYAVRYSPDPTHYQPRCTSCHKLFDLKALGR